MIRENNLNFKRNFDEIIATMAYILYGFIFSSHYGVKGIVIKTEVELPKNYFYD